MYIKNIKKSLISIFFVVVLAVSLLPISPMTVLADSSLLDTTVNVEAGDSNKYFSYDFEAGQAYNITASWTNVPTFTGSLTGWSLKSFSDSISMTAGDLILKTAKKDDTNNGSSIQDYTGVYIPTQDVSVLNLYTEGLVTSNSVTIEVESATVADGVLLDTTIDVAAGTEYLNEYFDVNFVKDTTYTITAEWANVPTFTDGTTAWKIQGVADSSVDGNGTIIYRATRDTGNNTAAQTYSGEFTPTEDIPVFNFFTQYFGSANQIHIKIEVDMSTLDSAVNIAAGDSNKYFSYDFEAGQAYNITASWTNVPTFTGSLTGWNLKSFSDSINMTAGDLILKTAKKDDTNNGSSVQNYTGVYISTQDVSVLNLYTEGLATANSITIEVEPTTTVDGVLLDTTMSLDSAMEFICTYSDVNFEVGKSYAITATWASAPAYTAANEGKTAWKVQAAQDSDVVGDDTIIYKTTASNNTAAQTYEGVFSCITANKPVFNFFTQRLNGANQISIKIELESTFTSEHVTCEKLFEVSQYSDNHILQGFDIFDDILFQCHDSGKCVTYDFTTGTKIAEFDLGSNYASNHCGNANFGLEYPSGNTQFPALYVSGDLTTKSCYVENVTSTSAQLVQTIYFDIDPSYTAGQVIIDRDRSRIVYMQRQNTNIRDDNVFKMCEFRIPALSEGAVVRFTNADIIGGPYELSYYSPLYQGAVIYQGSLLQTHGHDENSIGSEVGIMDFNVSTHMFEKHTDLTNWVAYEPQGITMYQGDLIMSFVDGSFYEITSLE